MKGEMLMANFIELPNDTLTTEEMPNFYAAGPYIVFRDYGGKLAHIYTMQMTRSLCKRHIRVWDPRGYVAGYKTCKRCLMIYRRRVGDDVKSIE